MLHTAGEPPVYGVPAHDDEESAQQAQLVTQKQRQRTIDVTTGAASFDELLLPPWLLHGLAAGGFMRPSPVQTAAIPIGRMGADLVVQAKSGTGKTLVFSIICLDKIRPEIATPQALILAPTHEIALQSAEVMGLLSATMPGIAIGVFIGGLPITEDQKLLRRRCQVAVGTPGRVCRLLETGALVSRNINTLVLDEADHLMSESFLADIRYLAKETLPKRKQVLALSATYSPALLAELDDLMSEPHHVMLCPETVSLLGVRQFYAELLGELEEEELLEAKAQALLRLLSSTTFHQALVFCNGQPEGQALADRLCALGYPAAFVSGAHAQVDRMDTIAAVHDFRVRVIVATDLASRGLDMANVNLVANLDLPYDAATYMHRVGRTGRFGTHGVAITFATPVELERLRGFLQDVAGGQIEPLPEHIPEELYIGPGQGVTSAAVESPAHGNHAGNEHGGGWVRETSEAAAPSGSGSGSEPDAREPAQPAAGRPQLLWTRSEGSLSTGADAAFDADSGSCAESDAEATSEVSADFSGAERRADTSAAEEADGGTDSGTAAAVLGASLWAAPPQRAGGGVASGSRAQLDPAEPAAARDAGEPAAVGVNAAELRRISISATAVQPSGPPFSAWQPPAGEASSGGGIVVSPELLVRYYQLEAFAAEYYTWFCQSQQQRQGFGNH